MGETPAVKDINTDQPLHAFVKHPRGFPLLLRRHIRKLACDRKHGIQCAIEHRWRAVSPPYPNIGEVVQRLTLVGLAFPDKFIRHKEGLLVDPGIEQMRGRKEGVEQPVRCLPRRERVVVGKQR